MLARCALALLHACTPDTSSGHAKRSALADPPLVGALPAAAPDVDADAVGLGTTGRCTTACAAEPWAAGALPLLEATESREMTSEAVCSRNKHRLLARVRTHGCPVAGVGGRGMLSNRKQAYMRRGAG